MSIWSSVNIDRKPNILDMPGRDDYGTEIAGMEGWVDVATSWCDVIRLTVEMMPQRAQVFLTVAEARELVARLQIAITHTEGDA
jgi:hypothetical protein